MKYRTFDMERWQSTWEHRVRYNLSESGVDPMSVGELLDLASVTVPHGAVAPGHAAPGEGPSGPAGGAEGEPAPTLLEEIRLGYGQSNGSDELRERIAALHPGAGAANVLVTAGGAEANFVATWKLLEPGEPVAVMLPAYMQVPGLVESLGGEVLPFRLLDGEDGWSPDLEALDRALERGARTIVVTNPNNPTGAVLSDESMEAVVERARRADAWILADEVYRGAEVAEVAEDPEGADDPDGAEDPGADPPETASFVGLYERVLSTGSLSKAYGLPGLRLGWVVGPEDTIADLWGRTDYTSIAPATLSDALALMALDPAVRPRILARTRRIVRRNLARVREWADDAGIFRYRAPEAGAICWLRYDAPVGSTDLAERLRTEHDVLIVPGDHFGIDGHVRIGFGLPPDDLDEALERVTRALEDARG